MISFVSQTISAPSLEKFLIQLLCIKTRSSENYLVEHPRPNNFSFGLFTSHTLPTISLMELLSLLMRETEMKKIKSEKQVFNNKSESLLCSRAPILFGRMAASITTRRQQPEESRIFHIHTHTMTILESFSLWKMKIDTRTYSTNHTSISSSLFVCDTKLLSFSFFLSSLAHTHTHITRENVGKNVYTHGCGASGEILKVG
jgi:hypothetical protein